MRDLANTVRPTGDDSVRKFLISLDLHPEKDAEVRSCEVLGGKYRNRTSFLEHVKLAEVFTDPVAVRLQECIEGLSNQREVRSMPDFAIEIPGLTLARAHMMVSKSQEDTFRVMIRFGTFFGSASRAFRSDIGFDDGAQDEVARVSALVLSDLVMPVLDICQAAQSGFFEGNDALSTFATELGRRSDEISFQIELIKRFADQVGNGATFSETVAMDEVSCTPQGWDYPKHLS